MSEVVINYKEKQSKLVKEQVKLILKKYPLSNEEKNEAAKDIADVLLTSWDLKHSDMVYGDTWFKETEKNE